MQTPTRPAEPADITAPLETAYLRPPRVPSLQDHFRASAPPVDSSFWHTEAAFGVAGGPLVHKLTAAGRERAFCVGARVRAGAGAVALELLYTRGGEGRFGHRVSGARYQPSDLVRFDQVAWGYLRSLGYVESIAPDHEAGLGDGVRLTKAGRLAVERGNDERRSLLERIRAAHPITGEVQS